MSRRIRTVEEAEQSQSAVTAPWPPPVETWTVNGKPVPEHLADMVGYPNTDQGKVDPRVAAQHREAAEAGRQRVSVSEPRWVKSDGTDFRNDLERFRDNPDPDSVDPLTATMRKYGRKGDGYAYKFFDSRTVEHRGGRGVGDEGYEPCIRPDGEPVRVADLVMHRKPLELADAERERDRLKSKRLTGEAEAVNVLRNPAQVVDADAVAQGAKNPHAFQNYASER
jgi:hypothetical protein